VVAVTPGRLGLPRGQRLRRGAGFQAVFREGRRVERPSFVALWRPVSGPSQVGFTASRGVGGAVERNRARRRLREAYRRGNRLPMAVAVVFVARSAALGQPFGGLVSEVEEAIRLIAQRAVGLAEGRAR